MCHTDSTVTINRPPADVFALVSDVDRAKVWQEGLVVARWTCERPRGVGSTYLFVTQFFGTRMDLPGEIIAWDPPNGWQWKANAGPFPVQGGYRLESADAVTRITMFSDAEPKGWMNAMRPVLKWMGERTYKHSLMWTLSIGRNTESRISRGNRPFRNDDFEFHAFQ